MKANKPLKIVLALTSFIVGWTMKADALEPKLLWEKQLPFEIKITVFDIKMAAQSGDIIVYSQKAREIILYDRNGNEQFHWGPRKDRQPSGIDISDDGNRIIYITAWTEEMFEKRITTHKVWDWDERIHYATKKGRELWSKKIQGGVVPELSPDGALVAYGLFEGQGGLTLLDSTGKRLWKYDGGQQQDIQFSPDGNYIFFDDVGGERHLFDKSGRLLWKREGNSGLIIHDSISEGAAYITTEKRTYNKKGDIIFEGHAYVSGDGKKLLIPSREKDVILNLPDKQVVREYPFWVSFLSNDGRFLRSRTSSDELLILDTISQLSKKITIKGEYDLRGNTKDGKYLVVVVEGRKLLFYQVY